MKTNKISLIISIVALVGVLLLFVDKLSNKTGSTNNDENSTEIVNNLGIVYVNLDTVLNNYDLYNALSLGLMQKQQDLEKELQSKMLSLQNRAYQLQSQYSQHLITTQNYQDKAQNLSDEQMQLQQWQEEKSYELQEDQMMLTQRVYDSIVNVVNEVNINKQYNLVISNSIGGTLLYGNPDWNITDTIVTILNSKVDANFLNDPTITN
ncbi:MAG: OmpH family outer membrane protein [Bacteroidales bacterium]|nr:OmpH family outer membrane protein [Bacteroidales bacterium]